MALNTITLSDSATSLSVTGGTVKTYTPDGQTVTNGIHVADNSVSDFRVKPHITWKNRNPQRLSDGTYSKGKKEIIVTVPYLNTTTNLVQFATASYSFSYNPEIPAASLKNARYLLAQCLFDVDAENFHVSGDIS